MQRYDKGLTLEVSPIEKKCKNVKFCKLQLRFCYVRSGRMWRIIRA